MNIESNQLTYIIGYGSRNTPSFDSDVKYLKIDTIQNGKIAPGIVIFTRLVWIIFDTFSMFSFNSWYIANEVGFRSPGEHF